MTLAWLAVLISIRLGTITWVFIIRRLINEEFGRKKMLALVPNKMILGNYLLKKYVDNLE